MRTGNAQWIAELQNMYHPISLREIPPTVRVVNGMYDWANWMYRINKLPIIRTMSIGAHNKSSVLPHRFHFQRPAAPISSRM